MTMARAVRTSDIEHVPLETPARVRVEPDQANVDRCGEWWLTDLLYVGENAVAAIVTRYAVPHFRAEQVWRVPINWVRQLGTDRTGCMEFPSRARYR